jgi:hypothetical protein
MLCSFWGISTIEYIVTFVAREQHVTRDYVAPKCFVHVIPTSSSYVMSTASVGVLEIEAVA